MPINEMLMSFLLACVAIELTPGPNMTYLALLSAQRGHKAGMMVVAGVATGLALNGSIAALGVAALIAESPAIYHLLRWVGVGYFLWLAYDCWRSDSVTPDPYHQYDARLFMRGFLINLLNPKAALFYSTVLPNFTDSNAPLLPQIAMLTLISVTIATIIHTLIVLLGARVKPYLEDPHIAKRTRQVFTLLLLLLAVWFALSTRL